MTRRGALAMHHGDAPAHPPLRSIPPMPVVARIAPTVASDLDATTPMRRQPRATPAPHDFDEIPTEVIDEPWFARVGSAAGSPSPQAWSTDEVRPRRITREPLAEPALLPPAPRVRGAVARPPALRAPLARAIPAPPAPPVEPAPPLTRDRSAIGPATAAPRLALPAPRSWLTRALATPALMHYHRLAALVVAVNVALAWSVAGTFELATLSRLALGNFAIAIVIRQHYVVNLLFWLATRVPTSWPLAIRRRCAKVYHFGGIHVGGALAGTAWFGVFTVAALAARASLSAPLLAVVVAQLAVLIAICVMSMPRIRVKHHDAFEIVKRFGGWASLALLWPQTALLVDGPLVAAPETWVLAAVTFSVALPWLRLRKVPVELVIPSNHVALARFDYGVTPFAGSSTAISRSPLREWHSFANVPAPGQPGFRLTISRAGDWTGKLIDDKPSHVWVKGIPTAGVANIEVLFERVVYIATGSGIGPCLPHLLANKVPAKLIWATRNVRKTYGDALVDEILEKHPDALIWDTHARGKPDMVALAYQAVIETGAEAVICISNKQLTWQVVSGMESRGIPAYGAIWDS